MAGQEPDTTPFTLPQNLFSFFANAPAGSGLSQPAMEARRRMVLQLMANSGKKGYPKNLGEGLTAIGDALGERGMMNQLTAQEAAYQKAAAAAAEGSVPGEARTGARTAYADPGDTETNAPAPEAGPVATAAPAAPMDTAANLTPDEAKAGVSGGGYNPVDAAMDPWIGRSRAIAGIESGGAKDPYATMGAPTRTGDRAYGKYQVMGANIPSWTQAALGTSMTPQQFLADKAAQEATFRNRFGGYADKLGEEGAARAWYGGPGANPNATDLHGRLTVAGYGQDYMKRLLGDQQTNPRDAVAQAMMMRPTARAVPQPNPTSTGGPTMPPTSPTGQTPTPSTPAPAGGPDQGPPPDQRMAFAGLPPEIATGVSAAPPVPPALQAVPKAAPQPAPQAATPVTPQRLDPQARMPVPQDVGMTDDEKRGYRLRAQGLALGDDNIAKQGQGLIDYGADQRKQEYNARLKDWQDQMLERRQRQQAEEAFQRTQSTPQAQASKAFGGLSEETVMEPVKKSTEMVKTIPAAQIAIQNALRVAPQMFSGSTAEVNLSLQKLMASAGFPVNPKIPATEEFKSFIAPVLSAARQALVGGANISDSDMRIARQAVGGEITLDAQTIPAVLASLSRMNVAMAIEHQRKLEVVGGNSPERQAALSTYALPMESIVPPEAVALLKSNPTPEMATHFNNKYHTPGLAQKMLGGP